VLVRREAIIPVFEALKENANSSYCKVYIEVKLNATQKLTDFMAKQCGAWINKANQE